MGQFGGEDPAQVAQKWLDDVAETFFNGDFDGFADAIALPFVLSTQTSRTVLTERHELRAGYVSWVRMIRGNQATHLIRRTRVAHAAGPDMIAATYDTDLLRDAIRIVPTFTSSMLLCRRRGVWQAEHLISGILNDRYPFNMLRVDPGAATPDCPGPRLAPGKRRPGNPTI